MTGELRRALEEGQFRPLYQPQVNSISGRITGLEALIRWMHPERGSISPAEFIQLAEETGLIIPITEWVLDEVCRQIRLWRDQGRPPLPVAVNLSASVFFHHPVGQWIERARFPPRCGCDANRSGNYREHRHEAGAGFSAPKLKGPGIRIAIDDFGTKYSALSYLKRFPVHKIKIDKSFIDGIGRDRKDEAIIAAMILVVEGLGLDIIAEGVEHPEQVDFLLALGRSQIQGYYYYRPMETAALHRSASGT
ncbi:EAL domain-containing protein [Paenibacillus sp. P25]|nr:EAL domain-containing protein [Paenibacillus sp. P25]